jgi:hypothetical protein
MQRLAWIFVFLAIGVTPCWADEAPPAGAEKPAAGAEEKAAPPAGEKPPAASAVQKVLPQDAEAVLGQRVLDQNGKTIGRLIDVLVNAAGQPQAAVIDFGGFMGVGNRKIAVHWSALKFNPSDAERKVVLDLTPDQIKAAPEYRNPDQPAPVVTPAAPASTAAQAHDAASAH